MVHQNLQVVPAERLSSHPDGGDMESWNTLQKDAGTKSKDGKPWPTLGAEIRGVTDFAALSDENIATIRKALNDYKVIWFCGYADKAHFTPWTQLPFAERF